MKEEVFQKNGKHSLISGAEIPREIRPLLIPFFCTLINKLDILSIMKEH